MKVNAIMVRLISVLFMAGLAALLSGASLFATSKISSFSAMSDSLDVLTDSLLIKQESQMSKGDSIVKTALQYLGVRYRRGATGPKMFDCSGFTSYVSSHINSPKITAAPNAIYSFSFVCFCIAILGLSFPSICFGIISYFDKKHKLYSSGNRWVVICKKL